MLQYPTNLYPDGATFDPSVLDEKNKISFAFNGDLLTGVAFKVYDYDTGEIIYINDKPYPQPDIYQDYHPIKYNEEEYKTPTGYLSRLQAGKDYGLQLELVQYTADGTSPLCDMFVLRGLTQEDYTPQAQNDYIVIKSNIDNIYEWDTNPENEGVRTRKTTEYGAILDQMEIVINGERKAFWGYNTIAGYILLLDSFSEPIPAGTPFQIYCNYKVSPLYFFKCRSNPTATATLTVIDNGGRNDASLGFHVDGTYLQDEGSFINYYTISLYWCWKDDGTVPWRFLDKTDKIYSQNIEYTFYDDFVLRYKKRVHGVVVDVSADEATDMYYKAVVDIVTADGATISVSSDSINRGGTNADFPYANIQNFIIHNSDIADLYYPDSIDAPINELSLNYKHWIHIVGGGIHRQDLPEGTKFTYYRENLQTGELKMLETADDITVPIKGKFRYYEVPRNSSGRAYLKGIAYRDIELGSDNMNGYTISELIPENDEGTRKTYRLGQQWKFVGDINDTTYTQNLDKYVHVGYNSYPSVTSTQTKYLSGTLSAMMGYADCTTIKFMDEIDKVRAWRDFITRQSIYMLKSQKGDVLIIAISNNPTTSYSEMSQELLTTFSFDWVEVCNVNDIKVYIDIGYDPNRDY